MECIPYVFNVIIYGTIHFYTSVFLYREAALGIGRHADLKAAYLILLKFSQLDFIRYFKDDINEEFAIYDQTRK